MSSLMVFSSFCTGTFGSFGVVLAHSFVKLIISVGFLDKDLAIFPLSDLTVLLFFDIFSSDVEIPKLGFGLDV